MLGDRFRTALQEKGRAALFECSLAALLEAVTDLGIDPRDVHVKGGAAVVAASEGSQ